MFPEPQKEMTAVAKMTAAMSRNWIHCLAIVMVRLNEKNFRWKVKSISRRSYSLFFDHLKKLGHGFRPIITLIYQLKGIGNQLSTELPVLQYMGYIGGKSFRLVGDQDVFAVHGNQAFGAFRSRNDWRAQGHRFKNLEARSSPTPDRDDANIA